LFLSKDIPVSIVDTENNFYFGNILFVGDESLTIQCFSPQHRKGQKFRIYYLLIEKFEECKEGK